jgi:hypothetical protein
MNIRNNFIPITQFTKNTRRNRKSVKEAELVFKGPSTKKTPGPEKFTNEFYQMI